ncbi:MAG: hypothetical protein AAGA96_01905 [Verrucomicrobiota bacterium]
MGTTHHGWFGRNIDGFIPNDRGDVAFATSIVDRVLPGGPIIDGLFVGSNENDVEAVVFEDSPALAAGIGLTFGASTIWAHTSDGEILFSTRLRGPGVTVSNEGAFFVARDTSIDLLAREGDPAPGAPAFQIDPSEVVATKNGQYAVFATVTGVTGTHDEIFTGTSVNDLTSRLSLLTDSTVSLPSGDIELEEIEEFTLLPNGDLVFITDSTTISSTGLQFGGDCLWRRSPNGNFTLVANCLGGFPNASPPGSTRRFSSFSRLSANDRGELVFRASLTGSSSGNVALCSATADNQIGLLVQKGETHDSKVITRVDLPYSRGLISRPLNDESDVVFGVVYANGSQAVLKTRIPCSQSNRFIWSAAASTDNWHTISGGVTNWDDEAANNQPMPPGTDGTERVRVDLGSQDTVFLSQQPAMIRELESSGTLNVQRDLEIGRTGSVVNMELDANLSVGDSFTFSGSLFWRSGVIAGSGFVDIPPTGRMRAVGNTMNLRTDVEVEGLLTNGGNLVIEHGAKIRVKPGGRLTYDSGTIMEPAPNASGGIEIAGGLLDVVALGNTTLEINVPLDVKANGGVEVTGVTKLLLSADSCFEDGTIWVDSPAPGGLQQLEGTMKISTPGVIATGNGAVSIHDRLLIGNGFGWNPQVRLILERGGVLEQEGAGGGITSGTRSGIGRLVLNGIQIGGANASDLFLTHQPSAISPTIALRGPGDSIIDARFDFSKVLLDVESGHLRLTGRGAFSQAPILGDVDLAPNPIRALTINAGSGPGEKVFVANGACIRGNGEVALLDILEIDPNRSVMFPQATGLVISTPFLVDGGEIVCNGLPIVSNRMFTLGGTLRAGNAVGASFQIRGGVLELRRLQGQNPTLDGVVLNNDCQIRHFREADLTLVPDPGPGVDGSVVNRDIYIMGGNILGISQEGFFNPGQLEVRNPDSGGSAPDVRIDTRLHNTGNLKVCDGATLTVNGDVEQLDGEHLTGGDWYVSPGARLNFPLRRVSRSSAFISIHGSGVFSAINTLGNFVNEIEGELILRSRANLSFAGNFENRGMMLVSGSSQFSCAGTFTQAGNLIGSGNIVAGVFQNQASVSPGSSPGVLSVTGSFEQTSTGSLQMEIGGQAVGTEHDQLAASGSVVLGGELLLCLIDDFVPVDGQSFTIVTGSSVTGTFSSVDITGVGGRTTFDVVYEPTQVRVVARDLSVSTYAAWQQAFFSPGHPDSGPGADPDEDGWNNFMEYAFGLRPGKHDADPVSFRSGAVSGAPYLDFTFSMPQGMTDVGLGFCTSDDLHNWTASPGTLMTAPGPERTYRVSLPVGTSRMFGKVRVEEVSP